MSAHRVIHGDCTLVLRDLAREGLLVDSVVTDPPYHLASIVARLSSPDSAPIQSGMTGVYARSSQGFMGQRWDGGDIAFQPSTWRRVFDVMKPGAHLIAFSATKGYHRMVCAIEDAGFEIRDMVPWLYGTGFPKSHDISKGIDNQLGVVRDVLAEGTPVKRMIPGANQNKRGWIKDNGREFVPTITAPASKQAANWQGWGTALKPAIEPVVLAQKPISEDSIAANVLRWGVGGLNIDACRIPVDGDADARNCSGRRGHDDDRDCGMDFRMTAEAGSDLGRWPANLCHDGSEEVLEAFAEYGDRGAIAPVHTRGSDKLRSTYGAFAGNIDEQGATFRGDTGTAARFFYSSKATQGERIFECRQCGAHQLGKLECGHDDYRTHPTVKPTSLMRWYVEMVTPLGALVLDPFAGTGTTAAAAGAAGMQSLSIEADANHVRDIGIRLGIDVEDLIRAEVHPAPYGLDEAQGALL